MPSFEEKQRRKALIDQLKETSRAVRLAELPMPKEKVAVYFAYLDQVLSEQGCDDTLRFTKQFATNNHLEFHLMKQWLSKYGGYCDCESLANVEDSFEDL